MGVSNIGSWLARGVRRLRIGNRTYMATDGDSVWPCRCEGNRCGTRPRFEEKRASFGRGPAAPEFPQIIEAHGAMLDAASTRRRRASAAVQPTRVSGVAKCARVNG